MNMTMFPPARLALAAIGAIILLAAPLRFAYAVQSITCTPAATTIAFGAYDVLSGLTVPAAGSFTVTCVSTGGGFGRTVTWTAKIPAPGTTARQMKPPSGTDVVTYNVYTDSARTIIWGDGTGGTQTSTNTLFVPRNGSATSAAINYYGLITPGGQDVSAASPGPAPTTYSQGLTITVTCTPVPPC